MSWWRSISVSAVELQRALAVSPGRLRVDRMTGGPSSADSHFDWVAPYLFYFEVPLDNRIGGPRDAGYVMWPR
jgi:hypothetical protein